MKILKFTLLILLLSVTNSLFAQDGQNPYLNSTQTYKVTMEDGAANTATWTITDKNGVALVPQPAITETKVANLATMVIEWNSSWASVSGDTNPNFRVEFRETKPGAGGCISLRSADITVQGNTFFLIVGGNANACHEENGEILAFGASAATTVDFTVTLDDASFALGLTTWEFDFTLGLAGSYAITEVKVDAGAAITDYTGISIDGINKSATVSVTITGDVATAETVTMTISNGKAIKGSIITPDNATGDKIQALTINALPNTSEISFN